MEYNKDSNSYYPSEQPAEERGVIVTHYASPEPAPARAPKKKKNRGLKITALVLALLLVLGSAGAGGAIVLNRFSDQIEARMSELEAKANEDTAETAESDTTEKITQSKDTVSLKTFSENTSAMSAAEIYEKYVGSVAAITTEGTYANIFGQSSTYASSGTGFIITEDGYILTNNHVVDGGTTVTVTLNDGSSYEATVVGADSGNDIAVIKIDATGLTPVNLGDSDEIVVGEDVAVIGNPLGELTNTLTVGIVSSTDRLINIDGTPINMFQTDAAVNSGNSGGPVFDATGRVIGIVSAKYADSSIEGLGFAIPINDALTVANSLIEYGYVTGRPALNVYARTIDSTTAAYYDVPVGAYIEQITAGGAGEKAGLQVGDIITAMDNTEITSRDDLNAAKLKYSAGDTAKLTVYRTGTTVTLTIVFDDASSDVAAEEEQSTQTIPFSNGGFPSSGM